MIAKPMTYVLIHGAWFDGSAYNSVAHHLRSQGHTVHHPTAAGHGPDGDRTATLADSADSIANYITEHVSGEFVLGGWSWGGVAAQLVVPRFRDQIERVVFHNAFVLKDGESVYDTMPGEVVDYFNSITDPDDGTITMPYGRARNRYMAEADTMTAEHIYRHHMFPVPSAMLSTKIDTTAWDEYIADREPWANTYINGTMDVAFPHGEWAWYPRYADRLGSPRVITIEHAGHGAPLTRPEKTAHALVEAGRD